MMEGCAEPRTLAKGHPLQPSWTSSTYETRFLQLEPLLRDRSVLDLGAASGHGRPDWLHRRVREVARRAVGVDIDEEGIRAAREQGFEIVVGDVQDLELGETFDVVLAGELIEHLSNFEGFLESVHRHLAPDGQLVITTPNAFCYTNFIYRYGFRPRVHHEHTCWFCEDTLRQLLDRYGFRVVETRYLPHETPGLVRRVIARLARVALPEKLAWRTVMVVAEST